MLFDSGVRVSIVVTGMFSCLMKNVGDRHTVPVEIHFAERTVGRCDQRLKDRTWT